VFSLNKSMNQKIKTVIKSNKDFILLVVFSIGTIWFVSKIEADLLRISVGTPLVAITVYYANVIGGFGKKRGKGFALTILIMGTLLFVAHII